VVIPHLSKSTESFFFKLGVSSIATLETLVVPTVDEVSHEYMRAENTLGVNGRSGFLSTP
jgi:hypothetical protein